MNHLKKLFLFLCLILIGFNVHQLIKTLSPSRLVSFPGIKFSGIEDALKTETHIGYMTDRSLDETPALIEYEQAQFVLAPAILEINNPSHRFLIINGSNDAAALRILQTTNTRPIKRNNFGVILAMKNNSDTPMGTSP